MLENCFCISNFMFNIRIKVKFLKGNDSNFATENSPVINETIHFIRYQLINDFMACWIKWKIFNIMKTQNCARIKCLFCSILEKIDLYFRNHHIMFNFFRLTSKILFMSFLKENVYIYIIKTVK